jgi:tRNA U34 5-methylaminomethyl-2-thiouridine-forming methyltransferase MnmC
MAEEKTIKKIYVTADGSHSVELPGQNLSYHSRHGAIRESEHVFIRAGLLRLMDMLPGKEPVNVLEIGFGTGLNAFLTALRAGTSGRQIRYTAIEKFPLEEIETSQLNYPAILGSPEIFRAIHAAAWNQMQAITPFFELEKIRCAVSDFISPANHHLVYFDAFDPAAQPEIWTEEIFRKMYDCMLPSALLVTYSSKGSVRRALQQAGFSVEKLPGPQGKREIVRAGKLISKLAD